MSNILVITDENGNVISKGDNSSPLTYVFTEGGEETKQVTVKNNGTQTISKLIVSATKEDGSPIPSDYPQIQFSNDDGNTYSSSIEFENIVPNGTVTFYVKVDTTGIEGPYLVTDIDLKFTIFY